MNSRIFSLGDKVLNALYDSSVSRSGLTIAQLAEHIPISDESDVSFVIKHLLELGQIKKTDPVLWRWLRRSETSKYVISAQGIERLSQLGIQSEQDLQRRWDRRIAWLGIFISILGIAIGYTVAIDSPPQSNFVPSPSADPNISATLTVLHQQGYPLENLVSSEAQWDSIIAREFDGIEMVLVPAGFLGSEAEDMRPELISQPFWIDRFEVTNEQYGALPECTSLSVRELVPFLVLLQPDHPHECNSWFEAHEFCSQRGDFVRLPTELEWEYAARGPAANIYPWGNTFISQNVVYEQNSRLPLPVDTSSIIWEEFINTSFPKPVGHEYRPDGQSWVGAYDMSGNLWEWVNAGLENNTSILRGGSRADIRENIAADSRVEEFRDRKKSEYGIRCARGYQIGDLSVLD